MFFSKWVWRKKPVQLPDAVVWIIFAICVTSKPLPGKPAHRWCPGQSVLQRIDTSKCPAHNCQCQPSPQRRHFNFSKKSSKFSNQQHSPSPHFRLSTSSIFTTLEIENNIMIDFCWMAKKQRTGHSLKKTQKKSFVNLVQPRRPIDRRSLSSSFSLFFYFNKK